MTSPASNAVLLLPVAFRDTALTVSELRRGVAPPSFDVFRQRCNDQVQRLREELQKHRHAEDVIEDAAYAQCALLDETALSHLVGDARNSWEREPLQISEFSTHHAGEELIARMEKRLAEPNPSRTLLAIFRAVLTLGFKGRFARDGHAARAALIQALGERLGLVPDTPDGVIVELGKRRRWFAQMSSYLGLLLAVLAVVAIYVLLDKWLTASVAQLVH